MAKVRVYELAKEFNMTNKALLTKLEEIGVEVKSHMSSLEDDQVNYIKKKLFGKEKLVAEVKVKPSVIRRRKMPAESKPPETTAGEQAEETPSPAEEKKDREASEEKETPPDREETKSASETVAADQEAETEQKAPDAEQETEEAASEPAEESMPSRETSEDAEEETSQEAADAPAAQEEPTPADEKETVPDQEATDEEKKPKTKKRKKKKSEPAKIVKLAEADTVAELKNRNEEKGPERAPEQKKKAEKGAKEKARQHKPEKEEKAARRRKAETGKTSPEKDFPVEAPPPPLDDASEEAKRKKKKDKRRKKEQEEEALQRKRTKKKKAVVEGDALYEKGYGRKKIKKRDARSKKGKFQKTQITTPKAVKRRIKIDEVIELSDLAKRMGIKANEMIQKLMGMGVMVTVNQTIDFDTAALVAAEFGYEVEKASFEEDVLLAKQEAQDDEGETIARAPVVTIMGHVDHGKTSLLDVIRKSKITAGEAGGITQHIGAYKVEIPNGEITFLDTPGHAAFTSMRARGAQITDLVVLVVAADDGVMPQTIEAINHSKEAGVPVVVAVNKMDKPNADPTRVMRELADHGVLAEDWGGDVVFVNVSAKAETGIDELLEMILLQSEVLELEANPDRKAFGYVVESRLDTGRGAVATVLVQHGTLRDGESVVCGLHSGKIRAMIDDLGNKTHETGPSTPVEIVGLSGVPDAGDEVVAVASEKDAKQISEHRLQKQRAKELAKKSRANLEKLFTNMGTQDVKELKLIVKADVHGSIEALTDSLKDMAREDVDIKVVHAAAGTVNESDVSLAAVSDAIIIGFNVRPTPQVSKIAKEEGIDMRFYDIIYDVINDISAALDGLMPSKFEEHVIGRAEVRDTFVVPGVGTIAGSYVLEGKVVRNKKARLLRDGVVKCDSELSSLKRYKDDAKEVMQGYECGIGIQKFNDIKVNDIIECYEIIEKRPGSE